MLVKSAFSRVLAVPLPDEVKDELLPTKVPPHLMETVLSLSTCVMTSRPLLGATPVTPVTAVTAARPATRVCEVPATMLMALPL